VRGLAPGSSPGCASSERYAHWIPSPPRPRYTQRLDRRSAARAASAPSVAASVSSQAARSSPSAGRTPRPTRPGSRGRSEAVRDPGTPMLPPRALAPRRRRPQAGGIRPRRACAARTRFARAPRAPPQVRSPRRSPGAGGGVPLGHSHQLGGQLRTRADLRLHSMAQRVARVVRDHGGRLVEGGPPREGQLLVKRRAHERMWEGAARRPLAVLDGEQPGVGRLVGCRERIVHPGELGGELERPGQTQHGAGSGQRAPARGAARQPREHDRRERARRVALEGVRRLQERGPELLEKRRRQQRAPPVCRASRSAARGESTPTPSAAASSATSPASRPASETVTPVGS
jgi:hypothetical protein